MTYEDRIEQLVEIVTAAADANVEYETTHKDALDAYTHMPWEGDWDYHNNDERVAERARGLGLAVPVTDEDRFGMACLERISWRFDSQYHGDGPDDLGAFPISEIETHIDFADLPQWFTEKSRDEQRSIIGDVNRAGGDHYVQGTSDGVNLFVYSTVDAAVFYSLSDKAIREAHGEVFAAEAAA